MSDLGWFSDMTWQQVLLVLAPVAVIIWLIKRLERHQDMAPYKHTEPAARAWLLLQSLHPHTSAKAMLLCDPQLLRAYMLAGQALQAKSALWLQTAIREYLNADGVNVKYSSDDDLSAVLSEYVDENTAEAVASMQRLWPVEPVEKAAGLASEMGENAAHTEGEAAELQNCESRQPNAVPNLEPIASELKPMPIWEDEPSNEAEGK